MTFKPTFRSCFQPAFGKGAQGIVRSGLALNLSSVFTASSDTIADKSGNGNDATPYTGGYASTDAVADVAIRATVSALPSGNYYLTGWVRPSGTVARMSMTGGSDQHTVTGLTDAVWQEFTSATFNGSPTQVIIGEDGNVFSAGDWADVKLVDADSGEEVGIWELNDSDAADLDDYICHDSSGNGYHGIYDGCAGGVNGGDILQMAGLDFSRDRRDYNNVSINTDFSTSRSPFENAVNGSYVLDQDGIGPTGDLRDNCIKLTPDAVDQVHYIRTSGGVFNTARACHVQLEIYIPSANTQCTGVGLMVNNGSYTTGSNDGVSGYVYNTPFETQGEWVTVSGYLESTLTGSRLLISLQNSDDITFANTNVESVYIREILAYEAFDEALIVPEDPTNLGFDVRGNAITDPRPNTRVRNAQGPSDYVEVADDASLDSLNTFAGWMYHDSTVRTLVDFSGGAGTIKISTLGAIVLALGFTDPTVYVGDADTPMSNTTALGSVGWKYVAVTFNDVTPTTSIQLKGRGGEETLYTTALTLEELETNRKATKGRY